MKVFGYIIATSVFVLVLSTGPAIADQDLLVSKKVTRINQLPHLVVNPNNGDLLIVWSQSDPNNDLNYGRVWAALVKRTASGKYKVRKPRMISPDSGYHFNGRAVWVPGKEEFFIVWDDYNPLFFTNAGPTSIWGRRIKAKSGKPMGKAIELISDENINFAPLITADLVDGKPDVRLYYSRFPAIATLPAKNFSTSAVSVSQPLNSKYKRTAEGKIFLECQSGGEACELLVDDVRASSKDRSCRVAVLNEQRFDDKGKFFKVTLLLIKNEQIVDTLITASRKTPPSMSSIDGKGTFSLLVGEESDGEFRGISLLYTISSDCSKITQAKGSFTANTELAEFLTIENNLKFVNPVNSFLVTAETDGWAYVRTLEIKKKVKQTSKEKLVRHDNKLEEMEGALLPSFLSGEVSTSASDLPNAAIVWTKGVIDNWQIWLHIID